MFTICHLDEGEIYTLANRTIMLVYRFLPLVEMT